MNWNSAKSDSSDLGKKKKGSLPSPGEGCQVSSHQACFSQSYKNWSESNGSVSGICKAASPSQFLEHITYSRLDSPVLSHVLLIHILIKICRIWELRSEGPVQEHTLDPFPHLSWWELKSSNLDLGFAGDSVYNDYKCQPSKPSWRGEPGLVQNWAMRFNNICSAIGSWVPKPGFAASSTGSWCRLADALLMQVSSSIPCGHRLGLVPSYQNICSAHLLHFCLN